jgi:glycosyltransferase involved in cell wall biosynthesis
MLVEAMACEVPVVASDSGEIPHVVGDAGVVVPENDEKAWVGALDELLSSAERRRALGIAGRKRAATEYSWQTIARAHDEFFREVIAQTKVS